MVGLKSSNLDQKMKNFDPNMIKAVALDIDGTIVNKDVVCTPRTEKAIKNLIATGREVYIVTGRAAITAMKFAEQLSIPKYMINFNGAAVWNFQTNQLEHENNLTPRATREIVRLVRKYNIMALVYADNQYYYELENNYLEQYLKRVSMPGKKMFLDEISPYAFHKVFIMGPHNEIFQLYHDIQINLPQQVTCLTTTPGMQNVADANSPLRCLEVMKFGVNKGAALQKLLQLNNISMDQVMSFGDDVNDVEMIKMSKWGIAMDNAHKDVKKVAAAETLSHNDDGVAYFIEKYLL